MALNPNDPLFEGAIRNIIREEIGSLPVLVRQLQGSAFTAYTPTWTASVTNPSIGNGTLEGRYAQLGKIVFLTIYIAMGSTSTRGSGVYNLSLPFEAADAAAWVLPVDLVNTGTQHYTGVGVIASTGTEFSEILVGDSSTGPVNWAATSPFSFDDTDRISISGLYEAAQ